MSQHNTAWAVLQHASLTQGSEPGSTPLESPWYVKILLAMSGWLAALFVFAFLGYALNGIFDNSMAALMVGILLMGAAYALLRQSKNEFVAHLALTTSLAGQGLILVAILNSSGKGDIVLWLAVLALQIELTVVMPHFIHRIFSTFASAFALDMLLRQLGFPYVAGCLILFLLVACWVHEFHYPQRIKTMQAIGYGLVLSVIYLQGARQFDHNIVDWLFGRNAPEALTQPWMVLILTMGAAFYLVWQLLKRYQQPVVGCVSMVSLSGAVLFCAATSQAQGLTAGVMILLLGFAASNRVLMGLGIASLMGFISMYYYLLSSTLLDKSQTLLLVAVVLLASRWVMRLTFTNKKVVTHVA